jgi:hypothetical protein
MNKAIAIRITLPLVVTLAASCGRGSTPISPTSRTTSTPTVQTIRIGSNSTGEGLTVGETAQLTATARMSDNSERRATGAPTIRLLETSPKRAF